MDHGRWRRAAGEPAAAVNPRPTLHTAGAWRNRPPGDRPPRRFRRAAGAHPGVLPAGHRPGRGLHRPGAHQGRRDDRPARADAGRHHRRGGQVPGSRSSTRNVDGVPTTAYFASDFTLAEIKTLRAKQSNAGRLAGLQRPVPDPDPGRGDRAGPGGEGPRGHLPGDQALHLPRGGGGFGANVFEDKLLAALHAAYGNATSAPVFIQSFEVANLQYLNGRTRIRLVQLVDADDVNPDGSMSLVPRFPRRPTTSW